MNLVETFGSGLVTAVVLFSIFLIVREIRKKVYENISNDDIKSFIISGIIFYIGILIIGLIKNISLFIGLFIIGPALLDIGVTLMFRRVKAIK